MKKQHSETFEFESLFIIINLYSVQSIKVNGYEFLPWTYNRMFNSVPKNRHQSGAVQVRSHGVFALPLTLEKMLYPFTIRH